jgi:hypothetical protein
MEKLREKARKWNRVHKLLKQNIPIEQILIEEPWVRRHVDSPPSIPVPDVICKRIRALCGFSSTHVDTVAQLINLPEQGNVHYGLYYNYIELGDDHLIRGYTVTLFGACSGTGDLLKVFEELEKINPKHSLLKYLPALRKAKGGSIKGLEGLGHVKGDPKKAKADYTKWKADDPKAHLAHIEGDLAHLPLSDLDWQTAVWNVFIDMYWQSAKEFCEKTGACAHRPGPVLSSPLAFAFLVDTSLNHGPATYWNSTDMWSFIKKLKGLPSNDEHKFLGQLINARRRVLRSGYGGLDWSKTGDRCLLYKKLLQEKNYELNRPIECANSTSATPIWQPNQIIV